MIEYLLNRIILIISDKQTNQNLKSINYKMYYKLEI